MILCEGWEISLENPCRVNIFGLLSNIRAVEKPFYPLLYRELCVLLVLTGGRGQGKCEIKCVFEDTDQIIFKTTKQSIRFPKDPLEVIGVPFRIRDCQFPVQGLYSIQFWYDERKVSDCPLQLR
jgi:hypothetical protein